MLRDGFELSRWVGKVEENELEAHNLVRDCTV
jgi:hypothetical protein